MTAEQTLLLGALNRAVVGSMPELDTNVDWQAFLALTARHALAPLICDGLRKAPDAWAQVPQAVKAQLENAYMQAIYQDSQREYMKEALQQGLTEAGISHIFLKGSCLKDSYPVPALRTMSDLDVLVYASDFDRIGEVATALGAQAISGDGNHRNFLFPGSTAVEFHPNLLHHATPVGTGINPGWQYAKKSDSCAKALTEEGFYLNTLCHLANHFVAGGVGVRFVLDVWVNVHLRKPAFDRSFVDEELNKLGLLEFARNIEQLVDAWFGKLPMTPLLEELGQYILTSTAHGSPEREVLNTVSLSRGGSRFAALWKKAFYPKAELEDRFPWCKGKPLLLPAAWCARAFKAVTRHGSVIVKWGKETGRIDKNAITENRERMRRFGIFDSNTDG